MSQTVRAAIVCAPTADDLAFLRSTRRGVRRRTASGPVGWFWRGVDRLCPRLRVLARRGVALLVLLTAAAALSVSSAPPASAIGLDPNTWCDRKEFHPVRADGGLLGEFLKTNWAASTNATGTPPATKWAQYGIAGTEWETFWLDCLDFKNVVNEAANMVFVLAKAISAIAIMLFMWTFKGDLLNIFLDDNQRVGGSTATLDDMIQRIHADVYLQLFSVAVIIAAIVIAFRFLFRREGGSALFGKFAAMILVAGIAFFYGGTPGGGGPHAAGILKTVNDWTNDITSVVLSAFAGTDCETPSIRTTAGDDSAAALKQRRDMALQCAAESLYEVTIYTPWAVGEFGTWERAPRQANGSPGPKTETETLAERALAQQAYSFADMKANNGDPAHYRDGRARPDSDICRDGGPDAGNKATYTGKLCDRAKMRQNEIGANDDEFDEQTWSWSSVTATNQTLWENWSGGQAGNRFQIALLALIGSSSIALIIIIVSIAYLMLEIATVMFALMAPVAFLLGLIPGFGMKILLRWLELLLGTFVKRIVLGLFVGLLMALYSVVLTIDMPWLMKLVLVCVIAAVGLTYRKKFTDAFALNFGGGDAIHKDGEMATGLVGGMVGGALGSRFAGGSAMSGMVGGAARKVAPNMSNAYQNEAMRRVAKYKPPSPPKK